MRIRKTAATLAGCATVAGALVAAALVALPSSAQAAPASTHYTGTLADGATWIADVPANWNGTLILFSHGFGPLTAQDAYDSASATQLEAEGYALTGSSYDPHGSLWALNSAVQDQFATVTAFSHTVRAPGRTISTGESMGGLINSLIAQNSDGRIAGAVTLCGLVAGAVDLTDYQLNGEYALTTLLAGASGVQLRDFASPTAAQDSGKTLAQAVSGAQNTAAGRARVALAGALFNETDWATGTSAPPATDYAGQEAQEAQTLTGGQLPFMLLAQYFIEQSAGGAPASNAGVDYGALLRSSPRYAQVNALYKEAGINLDADLQALDGGAHYKPEGQARQNLERTSTNTGHLPIPELNVHTISDQLIPVQQESTYAARVAAAGDANNLRQSYADAIGHCNFTSADVVAAVNTVVQRIDTGHWADTTTAASLNTLANTYTGLGGGNFLTYRPTALVVQPASPRS